MAYSGKGGGVSGGGPANDSASITSKHKRNEDVEDKRYLSQVTEESYIKSSGNGSLRDQDGNTPGSDTREKCSRQPRFIIDPSGELTHDETTVDIVTVPCPGGHPQKTWTRDGLMGRYFGAPSMRDVEIPESDRPGPSWVRQGIRREADKARILLYEHPSVSDGTTLGLLAEDLLQDLQMLRNEEGRERPLVFLGHSVGGIVIKMALERASRDARYEGILRQCYGVAFFGKKYEITVVSYFHC